MRRFSFSPIGATRAGTHTDRRFHTQRRTIEQAAELAERRRDTLRAAATVRAGLWT